MIDSETERIIISYYNSTTRPTFKYYDTWFTWSEMEKCYMSKDSYMIAWNSCQQTLVYLAKTHINSYKNQNEYGNQITFYDELVNEISNWTKGCIDVQTI